MAASSTDIHDHTSDEPIFCDVPEDFLRPPQDGAADADPPPPVDTQMRFPADGLYGYRMDEAKFGIPDSIAALMEVGRVWLLRGNPRIGVGDISKLGGGPLSGHGSHRKGIDVDLRPLRAGGEESPVTFQDAAYSREKTQELCDLIHANGKLAVQFVLFNDPKVEGVRPAGGHHNHLHIRHWFPGEQPPLPALAQGANSACVRELQRRINFWIAASPAGATAPLGVDGDFGAATRTALMAFQQAVGLPADGKAGPETWAKLPVAPLPAPAAVTS